MCIVAKNMAWRTKELMHMNSCKKVINGGTQSISIFSILPRKSILQSRFNHNAKAHVRNMHTVARKIAENGAKAAVNQAAKTSTHGQKNMCTLAGKLDVEKMNKDVLSGDPQLEEQGYDALHFYFSTVNRSGVVHHPVGKLDKETGNIIPLGNFTHGSSVNGVPTIPLPPGITANNPDLATTNIHRYENDTRPLDPKYFTNVINIAKDGSPEENDLFARLGVKRPLPGKNDTPKDDGF
jgi:hypothetical protein